MNEHLLTELSRRRQAELLREAERERLAAAAATSRRARVRRGAVTVEIRLSGDLRQDQIDQIFASLARHLG
jgi:hypothetical protein